MRVLDPWRIHPQAQALMGYEPTESNLWSRYDHALKRHYSTNAHTSTAPGSPQTIFWLTGWGRAWAKWRDEFKYEAYQTKGSAMPTDNPTYSYTFTACTCGMIEEPHYHVDTHDVIPWNELKNAMDKFNKPYSVGLHGMDVRVDPAMPEDQSKLVSYDKDGKVIDHVTIENIGKSDPYERTHGEKRPKRQSLCDHKSESRGGTINTEGLVHYCSICGLKFVHHGDLEES